MTAICVLSPNSASATRANEVAKAAKLIAEKEGIVVLLTAATVETVFGKKNISLGIPSSLFGVEQV
jgi:hypothetical protein